MDDLGFGTQSVPLVIPGNQLEHPIADQCPASTTGGTVVILDGGEFTTSPWTTTAYLE